MRLGIKSETPGSNFTTLTTGPWWNHDKCVAKSITIKVTYLQLHENFLVRIFYIIYEVHCCCGYDDGDADDVGYYGYDGILNVWVEALWRNLLLETWSPHSENRNNKIPFSFLSMKLSYHEFFFTQFLMRTTSYALSMVSCKIVVTTSWTVCSYNRFAWSPHYVVCN